MSDANAQMKSVINHRLVETGEKEKLKEMLRKRLTECGWRDQMKVMDKHFLSKYLNYSMQNYF